MVLHNYYNYDYRYYGLYPIIIVYQNLEIIPEFLKQFIQNNLGS